MVRGGVSRQMSPEIHCGRDEVPGNVLFSTVLSLSSPCARTGVTAERDVEDLKHPDLSHSSSVFPLNILFEIPCGLF